MTLIDSLKNTDFYPHPVYQIEVIETHISWLILTGEYAYKIKKPVDFGFLDFTTLAKRQHFCDEELRLNQRLAPDIYQQVITIGGTPEQPFFGSEEGIIEYAVQMRQFNPEQRLDLLLQNHCFEAGWIDTLAEQIADFHSRIPIVAKDSPWGEPDTIWQVVSDNFLHITDSISDLDDWAKVQKLSQYTAQQFRKLTPLIEQRKTEGHVRESHGDLHLANITLYHDELRLFDCIEFNLQFRWIDTISDIAFLLMDLEANGEFRWANRCLNRYLEISGDYQALPLLNFYKAYRSMVRAKVAVLGDEEMHDIPTLRRYLRLTDYYARDHKPALFLMNGISGSGKSHLSQQLIDQTDTIRIRSDVERKRLYRELSLKGEKLDLYGPQMNAHTFNHLLDTSAELLRNGYSVVVDATAIRQRTRQSYMDLADKLDVPMRIISCECEMKLIEARLKRRTSEGNDISDADIAVMQDQLKHQQKLTEAEKQITISVNTDDDDAIQRLLEQLRIQEVIF